MSVLVVQSPIGGNGQQFIDSNGLPLVSGKLYTYAAGTTTPQTTYTSVLGTVANANPIILGIDGRVASGGVWNIYGYSYKFVLKTSAGVLVDTWDNVTGYSSSQTKFYDVTIYGAVGDGVTDDRAVIQTVIDLAKVSGGIVYFPPGVYYISAALVMTLAADGDFPVKLQGAGSGSSIGSIIKGTGNYDLLQITQTGGGAANIRGWEVEGLSFRGGRRNIYTNYAAYASIHDCLFSQSLTGTPVAGLDMHNSSSLRIVDNQFFTFVGQTAMIDTDGSLHSITGNQFGEQVNVGLILLRTQSSAVTGNVFQGISDTCCKIQDCNSIAFTGNSLGSGTASATGLQLYQSNATVSIYGCHTVTGNTINMRGGGAFEYGIVIQGLNSSVIANNTIRSTTSISTATQGSAGLVDTLITNNKIQAFVAGVYGVFVSGLQVQAQWGDNTANPPRIILTTPQALNSYDRFIWSNLTVPGAVGITLPLAPHLGQTVVVQDAKGDAGANNITVTSADSINGAGTSVIATNYGRKTFVYNGTTWFAA